MNSSTASRLAAAIMIWALLMAAAVMLTDLVSPLLGELVTTALLLVTAAGIALVSYNWIWGRQPQVPNQEISSEKSKRDRLARALHNLSNDELLTLRKRISTGDIDDDQLAHLLDDSDSDQLKSYR